MPAHDVSIIRQLDMLRVGVARRKVIFSAWDFGGPERGQKKRFKRELINCLYIYIYVWEHPVYMFVKTEAKWRPARMGHKLW